MSLHSPDRLLQLAFSFRAAQALLGGLELGLFSELARGPRTGRQLRRALGLSERAAPELLDALVALGVLDREGDDAQAVYLNTREAARFLDRRSPDYLGTALAAGAQGYHAWGGLAAALKSDPGASAAAVGAPAEADDGLFAHAFDAFVERIDLGDEHGTLAYAGVPGDRLAAALGRRHPHWRSERFDIDASWPAADVIVLVGVLGACQPEDRPAAIHRAHAALRSGGRLIAIEPLIDAARRAEAFALLASLDALLGPAHELGFNAAEFDRWCADAGFAQTQVLPLCAACSAAIAQR